MPGHIFNDRILIIGGGYAGVSAALCLEQEGFTNVTLVDRKPFFFHQMMCTDGLLNDAHIQNVCTTYHESFKSAKFVNGDVSSLSTTAATLVDGTVINYDYVIVASGQIVDHPAIHTQHDDANDVLADITAANIHISNAEHICIIGGGASGVELAASLAHKYKSKTITLIHDKEHLVSENIASKSHDKLLHILQSNNVNVYLNEHAILDPLSWLSSDAAIRSVPRKPLGHPTGIAGAIERALMPGFGMSTAAQTTELQPSLTTTAPDLGRPSDAAALSLEEPKPVTTDASQPSTSTERPPEHKLEYEVYTFPVPEESRALPSFIETLTKSIKPSIVLGPVDRLGRCVGYDNYKRNLVLTDAGHYVVADVVLTCTGGISDSHFMRHSLSSCLDEKGYIKVDQFNRIISPHNVPLSSMFAIGDCCSHGYPKMGTVAMKNAEEVVYHIESMILNGEMDKHVNTVNPSSMILNFGYDTLSVSLEGGGIKTSKDANVITAEFQHLLQRGTPLETVLTATSLT